MPIVRTYACPECNHWIELVLTMDEVDQIEPVCPKCEVRTQQEFKPFGIGGSVSAKAHDIAESIITSDYHAADFQREHRREGTPAVRYKDEKTLPTATHWAKHNAALAEAVAIGRQTRLRYGSGLDVLQANIKSGAEPDLIANSKRQKMIKVW